MSTIQQRIDKQFPGNKHGVAVHPFAAGHISAICVH